MPCQLHELGDVKLSLLWRSALSLNDRRYEASDGGECMSHKLTVKNTNKKVRRMRGWREEWSLMFSAFWFQV